METNFAGQEDRFAVTEERSRFMGSQNASTLSTLSALPVSLVELQARAIHYESLDARALPSAGRGPTVFLLEDQNRQTTTMTTTTATKEHRQELRRVIENVLRITQV